MMNANTGNDRVKMKTLICCFWLLLTGFPVIAQQRENDLYDRQVFDEIWRVLKAGGVVQFADIANGNDVPEAARREVDLWTG